MSKAQDDRQHVKKMTRRAIKVSTYIMAPMMMGLVFTAEPLVNLILTEKWLPCAPFLRIFCITYMFWPIHTANLNAIKAMEYSLLLSSVLSQIINSFPNKNCWATAYKPVERYIAKHFAGNNDGCECVSHC